MWQHGEMTDLGTLGGLFSYATDINNRGQIVGYWRGNEGHVGAFLWQHGVMTDLGRLAGDVETSAWAINSRGQIVGSSCAGGDILCHAVMWTP
jgi:probable HAF family extracellular repeat protein